jgi:hypothetical protein
VIECLNKKILEFVNIKNNTVWMIIPYVPIPTYIMVQVFKTWSSLAAAQVLSCGNAVRKLVYLHYEQKLQIP